MSRISLGEEGTEIAELKKEIKFLRGVVEDKNDFIIWLVEQSGELDHTNLIELQNKFESIQNYERP